VSEGVRRLACLAVAGLLAVSACDIAGEPIDAERTEGGTEEGRESESRSVSVFDLRVGQCVDGVAEASGPTELFTVVACDAPHDGEVYRVFDLAGGDQAEFPGSSDVDADAASGCEVGFEGYVGVPYQESRFQATYVAPSEETWAGGDREVVCFAYVPQGVLRRSIEGAEE
jgi:hypothetical protein